MLPPSQAGKILIPSCGGDCKRQGDRWRQTPPQGSHAELCGVGSFTQCLCEPHPTIYGAGAPATGGL